MFRKPSPPFQINAISYLHRLVLLSFLCPNCIVQAAGTWLVNDISSPEVEELVKAFETMTTIIKFANVTLGSGNIKIAKQTYVDALVLFKKLGNDRGVRRHHLRAVVVYYSACALLPRNMP